MLRIESLRALRGQASENAGVRTALLRQVESGPGDAKDGNTQFEIDEQLVLALADVDDGDRPSLQSLRARVQRERPATLDAWLTRLGKEGDAAAGRRIFHHPKAGHCSRCHRADGRGCTIASDLTAVGRSASRRSLIESIIDPDKTVPGPYVSWVLVTNSGKVHSGVIVSEDSESVVVGTGDGRLTRLRREQIVSRHSQRNSLMPGNLATQLTVGEFRDLLAFLCHY